MHSVQVIKESKQQRPEIEEFSYKLGELVHKWGFKRIHGRIWSRLFLSARPLDAADLIEQLDISKALVSISLRELLDFNAVEEVGRSERGTNLFRANSDLQSIYMAVLKQREQRLITETRAALSVLGNLDVATLGTSEIDSSQVAALANHLELALNLLSVTLGQKSELKSESELELRVQQTVEKPTASLSN